MSEVDERSENFRRRLDLLVGALGLNAVMEAFSDSGVDPGEVAKMQGGVVPLDDMALGVLDEMMERMGSASGLVEDEGMTGGSEGDGADGGMPGVVLEGSPVVLDDALPKAVVASRAWNWEERQAEMRSSLRLMHSLAQMTQAQLGVRYQNFLSVFEMVAQIEWMLIYLGDTLPDPGMDWGSGQRMRELNLRVSRLIWVKRELNREHTGVRGIFNWLTGRQRLSSPDLVRRILEEADAMMGLLPEGGREVLGMRLPGVHVTEDADRYVEAVRLMGGAMGGAMAEAGAEAEVGD